MPKKKKTALIIMMALVGVAVLAVGTYYAIVSLFISAPQLDREAPYTLAPGGTALRMTKEGESGIFPAGNPTEQLGLAIVPIF
jgi:flagellar basal body-associated protein FliL